MLALQQVLVDDADRDERVDRLLLLIHDLAKVTVLVLGFDLLRRLFFLSAGIASKVRHVNRIAHLVVVFGIIACTFDDKFPNNE